jgi:Na+/phosphate symporter
MTTLYKPPQKKPNVEIQLLWLALAVFVALVLVVLTIRFFPAGKEWAHSEFVRMILEKFASRQWGGIR